MNAERKSLLGALTVGLGGEPIQGVILQLGIVLAHVGALVCCLLSKLSVVGASYGLRVTLLRY